MPGVYQVFPTHLIDIRSIITSPGATGARYTRISLSISHLVPANFKANAANLPGLPEVI
jgi:hypothetical protein